MSIVTSHSSVNAPGQYFIHIRGLPANYTWKELKDLVRHVATQGIWTEMSFSPHAHAAGEGYARMKKANEAENLCAYLNYKGYNVHLWDISSSPPRFCKCNCPSHTVSSPESASIAWLAGDNRSWKVVTPDPPTRQTVTVHQAAPGAGHPIARPADRSIMQNPQATMCRQMAAMHIQALPYSTSAQRYIAQPQSGPAQFHPEALSSSGMPVNTSRGLARTESRGVHISKVDYRAKRADIERLFSHVGTVIKCELRTDRATGRSKGTGSVRYSSKAEAERAVERFHGYPYMSMRLDVRLDKECTTVAPPPGGSSSQQSRHNHEPLIVTTPGNNQGGRL